MTCVCAGPTVGWVRMPGWGWTLLSHPWDSSRSRGAKGRAGGDRAFSHPMLKADGQTTEQRPSEDTHLWHDKLLPTHYLLWPSWWPYVISTAAAGLTKHSHSQLCRWLGVRVGAPLKPQWLWPSVIWASASPLPAGNTREPGDADMLMVRDVPLGLGQAQVDTEFWAALLKVVRATGTLPWRSSPPSPLWGWRI